MVNRRLFRPGFPEGREMGSGPGRSPQGPAPAKKPAPPEVTHAENFYWVKQMQARLPMTIVLLDGEALHGVIEWYDRDCIKLTRTGSPNLLVFKQAIKYVFKDGDESSSNGNE
jgi:host factor-I protein